MIQKKFQQQVQSGWVVNTVWEDVQPETAEALPGRTNLLSFELMEGLPFTFLLPWKYCYELFA